MQPPRCERSRGKDVIGTILASVLGRLFPAARSLCQVSWDLHTPKPAKTTAVPVAPFLARDSSTVGVCDDAASGQLCFFARRKSTSALPSTWCQVRFVCRSGTGQSDPPGDRPGWISPPVKAHASTLKEKIAPVQRMRDVTASVHPLQTFPVNFARFSTVCDDPRRHVVTFLCT